MKLLLKFIYSRRKLFSISKGVSRDLTNNLDIHPKEIHVVYNPIDEQMIQAKAIIPNSLIPKQDYIINVGRFHYQKRQDLLIKAYSKLKNRKKYKLVLIGEGDTLQDCKELVKSLNLENDVIFTGWQSNPYNWIKNACLFVLSSDTEGLPLVLLESLCCGTNIVSTYFEGIEDILTDNLQKNIVTPGNVDMLSKKIEVAINSNTKIDGSVIKKYYANNVAKNYLKYAEIDI
jgi:glycosyltransferase involved in cell wall biosynthesis